MAQPVQSPAVLLPSEPPIMWPGARWLNGLGVYLHHPPSVDLFARADLIGALLVGAGDEALQWLGGLLDGTRARRITVVLVVFPACATREEHLRQLAEWAAPRPQSKVSLDVRVLPMVDGVRGSSVRRVLPPTVVVAHDSQANWTLMSIGSVGNAGYDAPCLGSLNLVFRPDAGARDEWRRWFQYIVTRAADPNNDTVRIPGFAAAPGETEADRLWAAYERTCGAARSGEAALPKVDPETGNVLADSSGRAVKRWDDGRTELDSFAAELHRIYVSGWLVSVDRGTHARPLRIPVKAQLLGQASERSVGTVTQKQSFSLQVLDEDADRSIEKSRQAGDLLELLSFQLSPGLRWLPPAARALLEQELEARNEQGKRSLVKALGTKTLGEFISARRERIRRDLDAMHRELMRGEPLPADKLEAVLAEVRSRLTQALDARIAPKAVYNTIDVPDLTTRADGDNWQQPLSLLAHSARALRESLTDPYFPRRFSGLSFTMEDYHRACNVFGDAAIAAPDAQIAVRELAALKQILESEAPCRTQCMGIWQLIRRTGADLQAKGT